MVQSVCTGCHEVNQIQNSSGYSREGWQDLISTMVDLSGSPVASRDGQLVAHGGLERALDVQLASAQPQDAQVRIGVTFRDTGGALCRSFDSADLAGIACRAGDDWRLRQTFAVESAGGATQYRQAGSGDAAVMQAAQTMMAGAPLDAEAERRARDAGWR